MERTTYEAVVLGMLIAFAGGAVMLRYHRGQPRWAAEPTVALTGRVTVARLDAAPQRLNINVAGLAELDALPGITPSAACAIVACRTRRPFTDIAELAAIPGIGARRLEQLSQHLYCAPLANAAARTNELP